MKILIAALTTSVLLITGCAQPEITTTPVVTPTQVTTTTPVITSEAPTNEPPGVNPLDHLILITNFVNTVTTAYVTNYVTTTNWVANSTVTSIAGTSQSLAPIIQGLVPAPYGDIAGWAIGLLGLLGTTIAGAVAKSKNAQVNLHQSTLQSVVAGIENALPDVQTALTTNLPAGVASPTAQAAMAQAAAVIGAVKSSITSATAASGTHANLNAVLAKSGTGPTAA